MSAKRKPNRRVVETRSARQIFLTNREERNLNAVAGRHGYHTWQKWMHAHEREEAAARLQKKAMASQRGCPPEGGQS